MVICLGGGATEALGPGQYGIVSRTRAAAVKTWMKRSSSMCPQIWVIIAR